MNKVNWEEIEEHEVLEGLFGKFLHQNNMTIVRWRFNKGAELPAHEHPHEQLTMIVDGSLELNVGSTSHTLKPLDMLPIPSNITHSGKALMETIAIDIFSPVREDFLEKYPNQ